MITAAWAFAALFRAARRDYLLVMAAALGMATIFTAVTLHNAVREGARYGKVNPTQTGTIQTKVTEQVSKTGS